MSARQTSLVLGIITLVALVGVVVLLGLDKSVPAELYTFLGLGFGGHLALATPPRGTGSAAAASVVAEEAPKVLAALGVPESAQNATTAHTAGVTAPAPSPAPAPAAAAASA